MKKILFFILWFLLITVFFYPVFKSKIPAPLDTIVGLYHPFRDVVWNNFTSGVPYKNFLTTDPVRQQIPYRFMAIDRLKNGEIFSWNPYSFSGTPLSANIQTGQFYPLNVIFFLLPFPIAWSLIIILGPLLSGIFIYLYLRFFKLNKISCLVGSLAFSFSGFFIAWLEWGTLTHVILWLPLILLAKEHLLKKTTITWVFILIFAECSQLLAGHIQTSFYVLLFSAIYLFLRIAYLKNILKRSVPFILISIVVFLLVSVQYYPLLKLILLSSRNYDLPSWNSSSWFLPFPHLIQFLVPDFFGNPSTLNYFGEWNYGEFISYIGVIPLLFSLLAVIIRNDKKTRFFAAAFLITLFLILPNPISRLPFTMNIPFLNTAQPTRLISIIVFCLSVLSALGFDYYLSNPKKSGKVVAFLITIFGIILLASWSLTYSNVTKNNLILPTLLVIISSIVFYLFAKFRSKLLLYLVIVVIFLDLFRFGNKYNSFSNVSWFYPATNTIRFLTSQQEPFRVMTTDRRILPPNFSIMYKIEDVAGYDPLYLLNYARLIQAWTSNKPDIKPGQFNRIITPQNYESFIADLLNVRYVLSLTDIDSPKLVLRLKEGETRVYENMSSLPRAYFVEKLVKVKNIDEEINLMFSLADKLKYTAVSKDEIKVNDAALEDRETVQIVKKEANLIELKTNTKFKRLLVLSEINYPSWKAYIDNQESFIYTVNLALRAVLVPEGEHLLQFKYKEI